MTLSIFQSCPRRMINYTIKFLLYMPLLHMHLLLIIQSLQEAPSYSSVAQFSHDKQELNKTKTTILTHTHIYVQIYIYMHVYIVFSATKKARRIYKNWPKSTWRWTKGDHFGIGGLSGVPRWFSPMVEYYEGWGREKL